jgi:hypothetical protein
MLNIQIDQSFVEDELKKEIQKRLDKLDKAFVLWDVKELMKQTNMSLNFMKDHFFYHPNFPKYRIGAKWYFPSEEATAFILNWLKDQPRE